MSPNMDAVSCPCEHRCIEENSYHLGIQIDACGHSSPHEALSDFFMVDHVAHSKFDASSCPKEKNAQSQI